METTLKAGVTYTYNKYDFENKIYKTIDFIENWIKENDYQVTGNIEKYKDLSTNFKDLSMNQMKKIQKYCFWIERKPSLKKVNSFFSLLAKTYGIERVHVKVSLKEEAIQKAKKEWIKARNEADRLLKAYKDEKGDFYKRK